MAFLMGLATLWQGGQTNQVSTQIQGLGQMIRGNTSSMGGEGSQEPAGALVWKDREGEDRWVGGVGDNVCA